MKHIRTVIVDDHPLGRRRLRTLLDREPDIQVIAECRDGREAATMLREVQTDLVFLDVQMPELNGFDVMRDLRGEEAPLVIFVTAYDHYALQAFEVQACDYLLKPFGDERFGHALLRVRKQLERRRSEELSRRVLTLVRDAQVAALPEERLMIRTGSRILFVNPSQIGWIEAESNYLRLFLDTESHVMRGTIKDVETRIGRDFVRIHRSHAVNLRHVHELRTSGGDLSVVLTDGTVLRVGNNFREQLERRLRVG